MIYSHLRASLPVHRDQDQLRAQRSVTSTGSLYLYLYIMVVEQLFVVHAVCCITVSCLMVYIIQLFLHLDVLYSW